MSDQTVQPAASETPEVKTGKLANLKAKLPDGKRVRNALLLIGAGVAGTLVAQSKTKKTVHFDVETADIEPASNDSAD